MLSRHLTGRKLLLAIKHRMGNTNNSRPPSGVSTSSSSNTTNSNMSKFAKTPSLHLKCRNCAYPRDKSIVRFAVPDDKLSWSVPYPEYQPVEYTGPSVSKKPDWADIDIKNESGEHNILWNVIDGKVDRRSHMGPYEIVDRLPRNPVGRTGVCCRGHLGRWGPNHAADPIVTKWKRNSQNEIVKDSATQKPVLQFIAIQRKDSGEWAIPGGMVSPGEAVSITLKREFSEETMNSLELSEKEAAIVKKHVQDCFKGGIEVYRGYVDDPRNTDNAWMETVAVNFHDNTGESVGRFKLHAGDDAGAVKWTDISGQLVLYASHVDFIKYVVAHHNAHW